MATRPPAAEVVNRKSLADLMLESNSSMRRDTVKSFDEFLVSAQDFEMLVNGAQGGEYPHGLILIMQGRLGLETDLENFLSDST